MSCRKYTYPKCRDNATKNATTVQKWRKCLPKQEIIQIVNNLNPYLERL